MDSWENFVTFITIVGILLVVSFIATVGFLTYDAICAFKEWRQKRKDAKAEKNLYEARQYNIENNVETFNEARLIAEMQCAPSIRRPERFEDVGLSILAPKSLAFSTNPKQKHRWKVLEFGNGNTVAFECWNGCDGLMVIHKVNGELVYRNLNFPCRGAN